MEVRRRHAPHQHAAHAPGFFRQDRVTEFMLQWMPDKAVRLVSSFSVLPHFEAFQRGVLDLRDLVFFLSVIVFSLFCTGVVLRNLRSSH